MKKLFFASLCGILAGSSQLLAIGSGAEIQQRNMELEQLKKKCFELKENEQIKPFSVDVSCREISYNWRHAGPQGQQQRIQLQNESEIGGTIRFKNVEFPYQGASMEVQSTQAECVTLERWRKVVPAVDVKIGCEELNQITDLSSFCQQHIQQREKIDASVASYEKTGEAHSTCLQPQH